MNLINRMLVSLQLIIAIVLMPILIVILLFNRNGLADTVSAVAKNLVSSPNAFFIQAICIGLAALVFVIGVLAGGWALVAAFRRGWRLFRSGDSATWPLALVLLAGLAATVAHGLIDDSLFLVDLMALFMLTLGVLQRLGQAEDARSETGLSKRGETLGRRPT